MQNIAIRHSELLTKMADGSVEGVELRDGIGICRSQYWFYIRKSQRDRPVHHS